MYREDFLLACTLYEDLGELSLGDLLEMLYRTKCS